MISDLIRKSRDEVYCNTGIMPQYLYLGPQAYKDLLREAEDYLEPRKDHAFPELAPAPIKSKSKPPEKFMDMTIVERADWPSLMIVLAHTPVPECFEPEELIASLKTPKERRTVH
jgi:hypothetical protein